MKNIVTIIVDRITMSNFEYTHPNIVGIDLDRIVVSNLQNAGLNIEWGTFGNPYHVSRENEFFPVIPNHNLPENLLDKKVVIIDLCESISVEKQPNVSGEFSYWTTKTDSGIINPRYLSMDLLRNDFDRIYHTGGIFIIFTNQKYERYFKEVIGYLSETGNVEIDKSIKTIKHFHNWSFLTEFHSYNLSISKDLGSKIKIEKSFLSDLLSEYENKIIYYCHLKPNINEIREKWLRLARSKHN